MDANLLQGIVVLAAFVIVVGSLIVLSLLSLWKVVPADVIWLTLGIIGFGSFLVFLSTYM